MISAKGDPHGAGTFIYFTDDPKGRYNYTGEWENGQRSGEGEILTLFSIPMVQGDEEKVPILIWLRDTLILDRF